MDFKARVNVEPIDAGFKVVFEGCVHSDVAALERELHRVIVAKPRHVDIDLAAIDFLSSIGVGTLVGFRNGVVGGGGTVKIIALQKQTDRTLRYARLEKMFQIEPSAVIAPQKSAEPGK
ncbi:MAG: hypothetical protein JWO87_1315 [Phycisphaerales bacterium]|jgi:anti-anti-sigma factor|nr:hypothetical protein [Phycisphaerales bacterium]MDB5299652.1 hypothetical protein [Phycisphaerales bacterium]